MEKENDTQELRELKNIATKIKKSDASTYMPLAYHLYAMRQTREYKDKGYKNVYSYASDQFKIKKTTCCDMISIVLNYAKTDKDGQPTCELKPEYEGYSTSQLVAMLGMTDETRKRITKDMSIRTINGIAKKTPGDTAGNEGATGKTPMPDKNAQMLMLGSLCAGLNGEGMERLLEYAGEIGLIEKYRK